MLHLTLSEGDYVMLGEDIRVHYDHNTGQATLVLGIEAPRDVSVVRSKVYEDAVAKKAAEGDREAMRHLEQLTAENLERRRISGRRRAKRQYHGGRLAREARASG